MNKRVVVSGASSGIGFATAKMLQAAGYQVYGLSRNFPKEAYDFQYVLCDITDETQVKRAVATITSETEEVFALINCAGMGISGAVEFTSTSEIRKIFEVNLIGTFQLTKALIPFLRKSKNAKILNIGSIAGVLAIPFQAYYSVTKAGLNAYTEALRMELRPFGISVGAILPGDTKTNFTANREKSTAETNEFYGNRIVNSISRMEADEQNGKSPDTVAKACVKLFKNKTLPVFVAVGFQYKLFLFLNRILPHRFVNWILFQMYAK